jgi:hypothetical protein
MNSRRLVLCSGIALALVVAVAGAAMGSARQPALISKNLAGVGLSVTKPGP